MVKKWKKLDEKIVYQDPWIKVREDRVINSNGQDDSWIVVQEGNGAAVGALTDDNKLVLIRENRVGADEVMWHLPAGYFDLKEGETREDGAKRELQEETGYMAEEIIHLGDFHRAPSRYTQVMSYYFARGLQLGERNLDHNEDIDVGLIDFEEALSMVDRGEITDVETTVVMLLIDRYLRRCI